MIRKIIRIDESKCNGCGLCARACHEGAIEIVGGKAKLTRENYCDGLGDCLPNCPTGAISFEEREAPAYDEQAVAQYKRGSLMQWPTQIQLVPVTAPYYKNAKLLIAADCTAFAYARMHDEFIGGHVTINGCPKLDPVDYSVKLGQIIANNDIAEITLVRMEVPCCGGLEMAAKRAVAASGKQLAVHVVVISTDGKVLSR